MITGQVSHRVETESTTQEPWDRSTTDGKAIESLCEEDFFTRSESEESSSTLLNYFINELVNAAGSQKEIPLLRSLTTVMPHFTLTEPDKVVYSTVTKAMSATVADVEDYLHQMKTDLRLGDDGYPKKVILGGDQQTHAIVKNLKMKNPITLL